MKVEVAVLGSPSLIRPMVSIDVKQHLKNSPSLISLMVFVDVKQHFIKNCNIHRAQELCESRCVRSGLPVPNKPYGFCGRKATLR